MYNDFAMWLMEIIDSFDWSDLFAFFAGCLAMILYKNYQAMRWNRSRRSGGDRSVMGTESDSTAGERVQGRKISLPALNRKYLIWIVVLASMLGIMWSTLDTSRAIRNNVEDTQRLAIAVCENAKVSGVERKALQDLLIESMQAPENKLPAEDPQRQAAGKKIVLKYLGALDDAAKQRKAIQEGQPVDPNFWERYFGPDYPEPDCYATFR